MLQDDCLYLIESKVDVCPMTIVDDGVHMVCSRKFEIKDN